MTYYFIVNCRSGLVSRCTNYHAALRVASLIKGIVINARCPHALEIVNQYRRLWNT